MSERPILFNSDMVRAILDGRKTQTRRVVKPSFPPMNCVYKMLGNGSHLGCFADEEKHTFAAVPPTPTSKDHRIKCPYGEIGDQIWVRETHAILRMEGGHKHTATPDDGLCISCHQL